MSEEQTQIEEKETMRVCFWCGRPFDGSDKEIKKDDPIFVASYDPCDKCKEEIGDNIHVIGVTPEPIINEIPAIGKNDKDEDLYPTGSMFVAGENFLDMIFTQDKDNKTEEEIEEQKKAILEAKVLMLPEDTVLDIIKTVRESRGEESNEENIQSESN